MGAPFVLSGLHGAQGRVDAVAYWVISDHFEELGRPQRLFHNGFGLLSVGNLRKPRYWAVHLAENMGDQVLAVRSRGDGADTLVQAWATRHDDGTIDVLVWNGTINVALMAGDPRLDRQVSLQVSGLDGQLYQARLARVDERHSNIARPVPGRRAVAGRGAVGPAARRRRTARGAAARRHAEGGAASFSFHLPMPGIARIRLSAGGRGGSR